MGQLRFYAPEAERLLPHAVEWAYVAGLEAIPWRSKNSLAEGILTVERPVDESGNLYMPWNIPVLGQRVLSTCTLMEREQPYDLIRELARGTLYRARTLAAEMQTREREIPPEVDDRLREGLSALLSAPAQPLAAARDLGEKTIELACKAIEQLSVLECQAALEERGAAADGLQAVLASSLSDRAVSDELGERFTEAFHGLGIPFGWRQCQPADALPDWPWPEQRIEWARSQGLRVIAGPLIRLDRFSLPEWTYDFGVQRYEAFEAAATEYVRASIKAFRDRVDLWVCAGRLNLPGAIDFSEEQRLRLAVATLEAAHAAAPGTPVAISFDQPWGEYLASEAFDLSPLHFADALVRADLGVSAVALEINLGYWPGGTQPRDLLALGRHLDRWAVLGIPLLVYLSLPSRTGTDSQSRGSAQVVPHSPDDPDRPATGQDLAGNVIRLVLTNPAVLAVIWNQWSDADPHEFPHSGLLDPQGRPKPLLDTFASIRRQSTGQREDTYGTDAN